MAKDKTYEIREHKNGTGRGVVRGTATNPLQASNLRNHLRGKLPTGSSTTYTVHEK